MTKRTTDTNIVAAAGRGGSINQIDNGIFTDIFSQCSFHFPHGFGLARVDTRSVCV